MSHDSRLDAVDGLRGLAAMTVLAYHAIGLEGGYSRSGGLAPLIAQLKGGVGVFFVISGFVLYAPFARAIQRDGALPDWRRYVERRVVRILPGFWIALTAFAVVVPGTGILGPGAWRYYLLAHIYDPTTIMTGLGVAWSLAVEISFYAALPLFAAAMSRVGRRIPTARRQLLSLGALAMLSLALRIELAGGWVPEVQHRGFVAMTCLPGFVDWFAIGMALAVLRAEADRAVRLPASVAWLRERPALCWCAAAALFGLAAAIQPDDAFLPLYAPGAHLLVGIASGLLVLPAVLGSAGIRRSRLTHALCSRPAVWLGTISYGVYLWHPLMLDLVLGGPVQPPASRAGLAHTLLLLVTVAMGAVACAAASWYGVERPLRRLVAGRAAAAPATYTAPV